MRKQKLPAPKLRSLGFEIEVIESRYVPDDLRQQVRERDGHQCVRCGNASCLDNDHAIPWSLGGLSSLDNLQTLCRDCNSKKRDKTWWGPTLIDEGLRKYSNKESLQRFYEQQYLKGNLWIWFVS